MWNCDILSLNLSLANNCILNVSVIIILMKQTLQGNF